MALLDRQRALASLIDNFKTNTLKAGRAQITAGFLRGRRECLEKYWTSYQTNHAELRQDATLAEDVYFTNDEFSATELKYTGALGSLYDEEAQLAPPVARVPGHEPTSRNAHLPRITLPSFSGRSEDWESFRDLFRSLIHADNSLSGVQKLHYLKASVQGEAKGALGGITTTEANYAVAWKLLLDRYDNQQLLAQRHMCVLAAIRPLKDESSRSLQSLHDQIIKSREALLSLGRPVEHWDDWFVLFGSRGMDPVTRREWERRTRTAGQQTTYDQLTTFLQTSIQTLKSLELQREPREPSSSRPRVSKERSTARIFTTTTSKWSPCPACKGEHSLAHCRDFERMETAQRRALASRSHACYRCLRVGHNAHGCDSDSRCKRCSLKHHTLLHSFESRKREAHPRGQDTPMEKRQKTSSEATTLVTSPPPGTLP